MTSSKVLSRDISIFYKMSLLASKYGAINLSQGFPEFDPPAGLMKLVHHYLDSGFNQYAPMEGVLALREQISRVVEEKYGHSYNPDREITITAGATQAIFTAITAFVKEDDEVIIFEPAFDIYEPAIKLNGGKPVFVELTLPDFQINWEEVQKRITARTKLIIINNPHNPGARILKEEDLLRLQKIVQGSKILVLSDEVYENILYDGATHQSISRFPELASRGVYISSFGKTFSATGWKLGYCCAPEELSAEIRKVHQILVYAVNHPIQMAIADFMKNTEYMAELKSMYQAKRDLFRNLLKESRFELYPSEGSYYQICSYNKISELNDMEFVEWLTREKKIAAIPMSSFYHEKSNNKLIRFCFAKNEETLRKAAEVLNKL